jgi:PAS domain S-box-containing protein
MSTTFESLFELAPDAILVVDGSGAIVRANAQAAEMFGYARDQLIGQPIEILVPAPARAAHVAERDAYVAAPRTRRMGAGLDLRGVRQDGSELPVEVALAPITSPGGTVTLAIVRDVTVTRAAEETLRRSHDELEHRVAERTQELREANRRLVAEQVRRIQSEKMSSVGALAAGVAHEINNPLSGVMGLVKALEGGAVTAERQAGYFTAIRDGLERMRTTVRSLLDFSQPRADLRAEVDAHDVVAGCLRLVGPAGRERGVDVVATGGPPAIVVADRGQLMQALVNVLMNAIEASQPGSPVTIEVGTVPARVEIRVTDRGVGIPAENLAVVADPFFSTKPEGEGAGLGLTTALGIVHAHGGELAIDSTPGAGTTVTLALPAAGAV